MCFDEDIMKKGKVKAEQIDIKIHGECVQGLKLKVYAIYNFLPEHGRCWCTSK